MEEYTEYSKNCNTCARLKDGKCSVGETAGPGGGCTKYEFNIFIKRPPKRRGLPVFTDDDFSI